MAKNQQESEKIVEFRGDRCLRPLLPEGEYTLPKECEGESVLYPSIGEEGVIVDYAIFPDGAIKLAKCVGFGRRIGDILETLKGAHVRIIWGHDPKTNRETQTRIERLQ